MIGEGMKRTEWMQVHSKSLLETLRATVEIIKQVGEDNLMASGLDWDEDLGEEGEWVFTIRVRT
jgi:hypothetical protein